MTRRSYAGAAPVTQLAAGITAGSISFTVVSGGGNGYPDGSGGPFFVVLDENTADEEKVLIATRVGDVFNVAGGGRGADDTASAAHTPPCTVRHVYTATDADEANEHVNTDTSVHGKSGALVGDSDAQTLTNKMIDGTLNTLLAVPQSAITGLVAAQAAQDEAIAAAGLGWVPIADGAASGVTGWTIDSIPAGFTMLRVSARGNRADAGATLIGMRLNGLSGADYDYGLHEIVASSGTPFNASGTDVTIPRVAQWDSSIANNFVVDIFDVSSGTTVSWVSRFYRPNTAMGFAGGRRSGAVSITSLVFTHSASGNLNNVRWYLEGFKAS